VHAEVSHLVAWGFAERLDIVPQTTEDTVAAKKATVETSKIQK
jgi:hypothetical protein